MLQCLNFFNLCIGGFLAKYCIFNKGNMEVYRRAFNAVSVEFFVLIYSVLIGSWYWILIL